MIKIIGVLMIISSCSVMGLSFSREMRKRYKALREHIGAMHTIKAEILFKNAPLDSIMPLLRERCGQSTADFYIKTFDNAVTGMSFSKAASKNYYMLRKDGLENTDIDIIKSVCEVLGRYDGASQTEAINKGIAQLDVNLRTVKNEMDSKGKLYKAIGAAAGMALALIIV